MSVAFDPTEQSPQSQSDTEMSDAGTEAEEGESDTDADSGVQHSSLPSQTSTARLEPVRAAYCPQPRGEAGVTGDVVLRMVLECTQVVMCIRFSPDGSVLAAGQCDGVIRIFDPNTAQCPHVLFDDSTISPPHAVTAIRFKPSTEDDKPEHRHMLIATYASGMVKFWHYTSGSCVYTIKEPRRTYALDVNCTGDRFATSGSDCVINVYDMKEKKLLSQSSASDSKETMDGHQMSVYAVKYHPNSPHLFLSGGWDDTVHMWNDKEKHSMRRIFGPHICGDALDIDPTHNHILTGSWRNNDTLQIWDLTSGAKIKDVPLDTLRNSQLYCCQWVGKDSILCGGSESNLARVIDRGTLNTVGQVVDLPGGVYGIDNDRQGNRPKMAVAADTKIWIIKVEKKS